MKVKISCTNSQSKSVAFCLNGKEVDEIVVTALQDGEYWFEIGWYKTLNNAKKQATKKMAVYGYSLNQSELDKLTIETLLK